MRRPKGYQPYRRRRNPLRTVLAVLLLAAVLAFGTLEGAIVKGGHTDIPETPDVMLILGCQVKPWGPSVLLQDRLDAALSYLGTVEEEIPVVVSGGQGPDEHISEAQAMYDYLVEHGISEERIHREDQSHNTSENLQNSKELLSAMGYDMSGANVLIVSNDFHLTRACLLARRYGMETSRLAAPSSHLPSRIKMFFREPLALAKSILID